MVPRRGLDGISVSASLPEPCKTRSGRRGTDVGRIASSVSQIGSDDHELTWVVANWQRLPREIQITLLTVASNVIGGQARQ